MNSFFFYQSCRRRGRRGFVNSLLINKHCGSETAQNGLEIFFFKLNINTRLATTNNNNNILLLLNSQYLIKAPFMSI